MRRAPAMDGRPDLGCRDAYYQEAGHEFLPN